MWKHVHSEKALKTYGWAVISGIIFFGSRSTGCGSVRSRWRIPRALSCAAPLSKTTG